MKLCTYVVEVHTIHQYLHFEVIKKEKKRRKKQASKSSLPLFFLSASDPALLNERGS